MQKTADYRRHAHECRSLAARAKNDFLRIELLRIAEIWDRLADDRERLTRRKAANNE